MLVKHLPRTARGTGHPAHATVSKIHDLIRHLATTQEGGLGFVWNTPFGPPLPAHLIDMMGPSTVLNASKLGSGAHRHTRIWQILLPTAEIDATYAQLADNPRTINEILDLAGIDSWRMPTESTSTAQTNPPKAMPRFRTRQTPPLRMDTGQTSLTGILLQYGALMAPPPQRLEKSSWASPMGIRIRETSPQANVTTSLANAHTSISFIGPWPSPVPPPRVIPPPTQERPRTPQERPTTHSLSLSPP
jgi:hypothetical protein